MRSTRFFVILTAALVCVAATAAAHMGTGKANTTLMAGQTIEVGHVDIWNNGKQLNGDGEDIGSKLMVQIYFEPDSPWRMIDAKAYVGPHDGEIPSKKGNPTLGKFPFKHEFSNPVQAHTFVVDLEDDLDFSWGERHPRIVKVAVHADVVKLDAAGNVIQEEGAWAFAGEFEAKEFDGSQWGWYFTYELAHPRRGHFIDAQVKGHGFITPTHAGTAGDDEKGGFWFFSDEWIDLFIGPPTYDSQYSFYLGTAEAAKKISPLDMYDGAGTDDPRVIGVARVLQTLDSHERSGNITINPNVAACFNNIARTQDFDYLDFGDEAAVEAVLTAVVSDPPTGCQGTDGVTLELVSATDAKGNLEAGLNASGIFRKNISKNEDWGETKQKLEVMPVYLPGVRSNGDPSLCVDVNGDGIYDEGEDTLGVAYEEWRMDGDPAGEECDPRVDGEACVVTLIECRDVAKPLLVTYMEKVDIYDGQVNEDFWPGRFSWDVFTAISRDDGTTWKRRNVSRMADLSSFDLETGEPFPGTTGSPYLKVNDNYILNVWESKFCKSGNPRYSITTCDDPATTEVELPLDLDNGDFTGCQEICRGNLDNGTQVCEPDDPNDDAYFVTDIWGVRGQQRSVQYNEVDDVAELGIGEIPYSCLWATRGVIVTEKELAEGTFSSLTVDDNLSCISNGEPWDCCTGLETGTCEARAAALGDIIWYKPERLTSGRRDTYIPVVNSARGAGFAIAWQEDPKGLRPGKGKGPGEGWSGAISNHKTDIWYTYLTFNDFADVNVNFVPGGPGDDPNGEASFDERPGLGRPKAQVPFSLPVRVSDNDMVNTHTLKVEPSSTCVTPPDGTEPICFPEVVDDTFVPIDPEEIEAMFCGHPDADPTTCCDPDNHEGDPNCEELKGLFGNATGTKRYSYMARDIDEIDNATGAWVLGGDGLPDYQYYVNRGGTLDLCDLSGDNSYMEVLPGENHERWFGFTNAAGASKLVCVSSDGRLLDGDVFASRPMLQLQPYTKPDGSKGAWALLAYEESKGMGHSLAAEAHEDDGDEILGGGEDESGQEKPIKQDIGKNMLYHSFDFTQPDLVHPGHIANLPALCGGLYPTYCDDPKTPDIIEDGGGNPTCTCEPGQPVPLYFDYLLDSDGNPDTPDEWWPDTNLFLQYRTEIARRARFLMQSPGRMAATKTLGAIIFKQGQEGQGRPADAFIRRFVKSGTGNPYKFENMECNTYLDETFALPGCPNDDIQGYNCNVWGEAYGDRLCGGVFTDPTDGHQRRDHINLTSADVDLAVGTGPDDDTPDDPTDDVYNRNKVLLWSQYARNLGDESFGALDGTACDPLAGEVCPGMYSNVRSHRGFIRGDFFAIAYALTPNWAAARNGNDRYNFYVRKSFDGGKTWTTTPSTLSGGGTSYCREYRTDPNTKEAPIYDGFDPLCVEWCAPDDTECVMTGTNVSAGSFEPARNVSQILSNKETSADPRLGATPPVYPIDGRDAGLPVLRMVEDEYLDNVFFVAWGTADNSKSTGGDSLKTEATPLDLYYTRSVDYGDHFLKVPWLIGGENSNLGVGETVWRYEHVAKGEPEEQGECQLRATSDGSKAYVIWHSMIPEEEDPTATPTRWYPWKPEVTYENDLWMRRLIFWPDELTTP